MRNDKGVKIESMDKIKENSILGTFLNLKSISF